MTINDDRSEEGDPPVHEHVRMMAEFFDRFTLPEKPVRRESWLAQQVDGLLEAHANGDLAVVMPIQLAHMPAERPTAEAVLESELGRDAAQRVIATTYCFDSWDVAMASSDAEVDPCFEAAVDAVVHGDFDELTRQLGERPSLVHARSTYGHLATLLHYVAANGVEIQRQRTPRNAKDIARVLFDMGAEADALCECYGGGQNSTTLCLTVSSCHPYAAGVQADIVAALLDGGAEINGLNDDAMPLATALAFGYASTAAYLVERGARVDNVVLAAGLGRPDLVDAMFDATGKIRHERPYVDPFGEKISEPQQIIDRAYFLACKCGHVRVVEMLLNRGADVNFAPQRSESALHWACYEGHMPVVQLLVERAADIACTDEQ